MKLFSFVFLIFTIFLSAQNPEKIDIRNYVVKANFLENKFDEKYLLIGDFLPVAEGSKIKLARVYTNTGWGYIDEKGNEVVKPVYERLSYFKSGYVMASEKYITQFDWNSKEFPVIINYFGEILTQPKDFIYDIKYPDCYEKDFFVTGRNRQNGVLTNRGKDLIPFKYSLIKYSKNYFFAENHIEHNSDLRLIDIYTKKGKLLKTLVLRGISEEDKYFIISDKENEYFVDKKTFKRIDNRVYGYITKVENSIKTKYVAQYFSENGTNVNSYFLDKNLKIINQNFPNSFNYEDRFFVQPLKATKQHPAKYIISNFQNKKIAEYPEDDYYLFQTFAHRKLDDPKFLESMKSYWEKIDSKDLSNRWDYIIDLEYRKRYISFYERDSLSKKIRTKGFIDANSGKMVIKRNALDVKFIEHIAGTDFFFIKYDDRDGSKIDIFNDKDKLVRTDSGNYISDNGNFSNNPIPDFYILNKRKDTLNHYNITVEQLLKPKDMRPLSDEDYMFYRNDWRNYLVYGSFKTRKFGVIDSTYTVKIPPIYHQITNDSTGKNILILKKDDNDIQIADDRNFKILFEVQLKDGILKKYSKDQNKGYPTTYFNGYYEKGFYLIAENKIIIDRYGNIVKKPTNIEFDTAFF